MYCSDFVNTLISFPKTVVVAVNGPAVGFGMALLALCDVVYASDKASFSCPYTRLCQTPEACASYTLPKILGSAMVSLACVNIGITTTRSCPPTSETLAQQHISFPWLLRLLASRMLQNAWTFYLNLAITALLGVTSTGEVI